MKFKNLFKRKNTGINDELVRKILYNFFSNTDKIQLAIFITNVEFKELSDQVNVIITTHRPGTLIGKGGRYIGSLAKHLTEVFSKKTKIDIKESELWKIS